MPALSLVNNDDYRPDVAHVYRRLHGNPECVQVPRCLDTVYISHQDAPRTGLAVCLWGQTCTEELLLELQQCVRGDILEAQPCRSLSSDYSANRGGIANHRERKVGAGEQPHLRVPVTYLDHIADESLLIHHQVLYCNAFFAAPIEHERVQPQVHAPGSDLCAHVTELG